MAVEELEAVEHVMALERADGTQQLGDREPELALDPDRGGPTPRTRGGEFDAHPDAGADAVLFSEVDDQHQLLEVLDDRDNGSAELVGQDDRFDVLSVFEPVADDQLVGGLDGHRHNRQQLGLGSDLEPVPELVPVACDLLDDMVLLIHLDGIRGKVLAFIVVLGDGTIECLADGPEAMVDNVSESQQHGCVDTTLTEPLDDLVEVDACLFWTERVGVEVPVLIDAEVALGPSVGAVDFL